MSRKIPKVAIIGYGHVGEMIDCLIKGPFSGVQVIRYDKMFEPFNTDEFGMAGIGTKKDVNECDYAFICVPTPLSEDTGLLDTSEVDEVLNWCTVKNICIKSTVPVGYTETKMIKEISVHDGDKLITQKIERNIVFSPEYYGETNCHPYGKDGADWLILGGKPEATKIFADLMQTWYPSTTKIHITDSRTAELAKFMENSFLATKVTFCNTFYNIAEAFGVDYHKLREAWLMDPRIGESHTMVYPKNRGYGGKCLPKDIQNISTQAHRKDVNVDLLDAVIDANNFMPYYSKED